VIIIFGINRLGVFGEGIQYTKIKMNRNFNTFADLKPLEIKIPIICLATGCVSGHRDRRYSLAILLIVLLIALKQL
jgi:hypothetical protein